MNVTAQGAPESPRSSKRQRPITARVAGLSDRGNVRETNQDQLLVGAPGSAPAPELPGGLAETQLLVVADGMGGHAGGERASSIAVRTLSSTLLPALERLPADVDLDAAIAAELRRAFQRAHANVREEAERHPELFGMGTTLTAAYRHGARLFVAHVGDSRCYLFRDGMLSQITQDHTLVNQLVRAGFLELAEEASPSIRSILTNVIGVASEPVKVDMHVLRLRAGDALLLCSDGLTGPVSDAAIAAALEAYTEPLMAVEHLVDAAIDAGGPDNITAIVARCD